MVFDVSSGVVPEREMKKIDDACDTGKIAPLVIGGKPQGSRNARWYIRSRNAAEYLYDNRGLLHRIEVEIELKEYH
jgi:hypothetical protein